MDPKKLEWIRRIIREDMGTSSLPTNHTGKQIANFDPLLAGGKVEKRKKYLSLGPGSRKRWMKDNGKS